MIAIPQCMDCKHRKENTLQCEAFPENIPMEILLNEFDHREPYDKDGVSDGGIMFEPVAGKKSVFDQSE